MAERKRPRRTRERILETSLALFNRLGEPNVTTATIADEMNISPGNLYYHFRNKDEIVGELYDALEARLLPLLAVPEDRAPDVEDLWFLLHMLFEAMWTYRFFYRDVVELTTRVRRIGIAFSAFVRRAEATVVALAHGMRAAGSLQASDRELAAMARNAVIVATWWMSFQRTSTPPPARAHDDDRSAPELDRAAYQVLALVAPFAVGQTREHLTRLGERYL